MLKKEYNKIYSVLIISILVLTTSFGTVFPILGPSSKSTINSAWSPPAESRTNYAAALQKSIYFYLEQRSGDLPADNPVIWRGDSCLNDGSDHGLDLSGGYLDAGDNVKFGLPMASTVATLALGVMEYRSGFQSAGQLDEVLDAIKWGTDYFMKCSPNSNTFYFQVGDGNADHSWWGPVEVIENVMSRPSYAATTSQGGSCVTGASAAALALSSIIFESSNPSYASQCLTYAERLYNLARAMQSDSYYVSIASSFYNSYSGFWDELAATGAILYLKTGDNSYLTQAEEAAQNWNTKDQTDLWEYEWGHSWDDMHYIAQMLLADITGKQIYIDSVERNLDYWMPGGGITYSPGGLAWLDSWGSLRYAANTAFLAFMWAENSLCTSSKVSTYNNFAEDQINYILGDNPRSRSYICGFGTNPPVNPHHRTAHGSWANSINTPEQTRHILYGALVGGPDASDNYQDVRTDYTMNEVACDYNAGLVAALAKMTDMYGGSPHNDFPGPDWFIPESERLPEMYADARLNSEGNQYTEMSVDLVNHAAWPARDGTAMSYRYYFDITECIAAGYSINDIVIESGYSEVPTSITGPHHVEGNVYYVLVDYSGSNIFPGGQSESARETQVRIRLPYDAPASAWDTSNDWSHQGLSNTRAPSEYIPVFDNGVLVYGQPVGDIITPPTINSPSNVNYEIGKTGNSITWTATDDNPTTYTVTRDSTQVASGSWSSGSPITVSVDGLSVGTYTYTCTVRDGDGQTDSDSVTVSVTESPTQAPIINSPSNVNYQEGATGNSITWTATDDNPTTYTVTRDSTQVASGSWSSGSPITVSVDGLSVGTYTYTCTVRDGDGQTDSDSVTVTVSESTQFQNGDVNHNGVVDIVDALLIAQYYVGSDPQPFYTDVADVNHDGSINIIDALLVAQYYVGLIDELP